MHQDKNQVPNTEHKTEEPETIPAILLFNQDDETCTFEKGSIPILKSMNTTTFWASTGTEEWEKVPHPAPRRQYVVTLKGKIKFKVSDGSTFMIEPGIILIAEDTEGAGHSWEMVDSDQWHRLYIPMAEGADNHFMAENKD